MVPIMIGDFNVSISELPTYQIKRLVKTEIEQDNQQILFNRYAVLYTENFAFQKYTSPPLSVRDTFQDPQWMAETMDGAKPYICYVFSYTYIHTYDTV